MRWMPFLLAGLLVSNIAWADGLGEIKIMGMPSPKDGVIAQTVGQIITISVSADGAKEYSISHKPGNSSFQWNRGGGTLAWMPREADIGEYNITFKATDGDAIKSVSVQVRIEGATLK